MSAPSKNGNSKKVKSKSKPNNGAPVEDKSKPQNAKKSDAKSRQKENSSKLSTSRIELKQIQEVTSTPEFPPWRLRYEGQYPELPSSRRLQKNNKTKYPKKEADRKSEDKNRRQRKKTKVKEDTETHMLLGDQAGYTGPSIPPPYERNKLLPPSRRFFPRCPPPVPPSTPLKSNITRFPARTTSVYTLLRNLRISDAEKTDDKKKKK